ncbi:hypothetical protein VP177E371_P0077 [Vibrio phage 177E37-1]|nr:hypothetical protein VP177E371_P0077 [Vibrio phage 177E37-1]
MFYCWDALVLPHRQRGSVTRKRLTIYAVMR